MTAKQIEKKLQPFLATLSRKSQGRITMATDEVEVQPGINGSDALAKRVSKFLGWGGYRTGYGAWVFSPGYQSNGDWNDKSSRWHY